MSYFSNTTPYPKDQAALAFVHPFMLEVMTICGANRWLPPSNDFHFSSRGRNANVSQYGPAAFVLKELVNCSSETASKNAARKASAVGADGVGETPSRMLWVHEQ